MGSEIADLLRNYRDLAELKIRVEGIVLECDTLSAQLAAANERAEKAEAERADALRCSGENAKAYQEAVCDEAVKRTHLLKEIGLTEQQRDAFASRVAELEGALHELKAEYESAGSRDDERKVTYNWSLTRIAAALAHTPAQSLAKVQAAALSAMAKTICEGTEHPVALAVVHLIQTEAERLEAEAANG